MSDVRGMDENVVSMVRLLLETRTRAKKINSMLVKKNESLSLYVRCQALAPVQVHLSEKLLH